LKRKDRKKNRNKINFTLQAQPTEIKVRKKEILSKKIEEKLGGNY